MKKHPLMNKANFKILSTSKYFNHNGIVVASVLVAIHFLDYSNFNELTQNIHGRATGGRSNNVLNWEKTVNTCADKEEKV